MGKLEYQGNYYNIIFEKTIKPFEQYIIKAERNGIKYLFEKNAMISWVTGERYNKYINITV